MREIALLLKRPLLARRNRFPALPKTKDIVFHALVCFVKVNGKEEFI